jgi:hypothetical protein
MISIDNVPTKMNQDERYFVETVNKTQDFVPHLATIMENHKQGLRLLRTRWKDGIESIHTLMIVLP